MFTFFDSFNERSGQTLFPMMPQEKRKWQMEVENKKRQLEDDRRALQHLKVPLPQTEAVAMETCPVVCKLKKFESNNYRPIRGKEPGW